MRASISIKTDDHNEEDYLLSVLFKLGTTFMFGLAILIIFYSRKVKRLERQNTMFFKIYNNLLEVNPDILKVEDKQEILVDVHDQVRKIVGDDELNRQANLSKVALKEEIKTKLKKIKT